MRYNKLAYRMYKTLSTDQQKALSIEYDIERVDNTDNKKWNDRFLFSFCNWLWMNKFKKNKHVLVPLLVQIDKLKNSYTKLLAEGILNK